MSGRQEENRTFSERVDLRIARSGRCGARLAPEGPHEADCQNRDQVVAWSASARAAGAHAVVTEVTAGAGTLLVGLEVTGTAAAREVGGPVERWQDLTLRGARIVDIRGFDDRAAAAARAGITA